MPCAVKTRRIGGRSRSASRRSGVWRFGCGLRYALASRHTAYMTQSEAMGADAPQFPRNTHSRERSRHGHGDHEARSDRLTHQDSRNDGQGTRLSLLWVFAILNDLYCTHMLRRARDALSCVVAARLLT